MARLQGVPKKVSFKICDALLDAPGFAQSLNTEQITLNITEHIDLFSVAIVRNWVHLRHISLIVSTKTRVLGDNSEDLIVLHAELWSQQGA